MTLKPRLLNLLLAQSRLPKLDFGTETGYADYAPLKDTELFMSVFWVYSFNKYKTMWCYVKESTYYRNDSLFCSAGKSE